MEAPEYRTRLLNISEKSAACGPYIMLRKSCPRMSATVISTILRVSTSQNRGKDHSPNSTAPVRYTGRRPTRSESADQAGSMKIWAKLEIKTAVNIALLDKPRSLVP